MSVLCGFVSFALVLLHLRSEHFSKRGERKLTMSSSRWLELDIDGKITSRNL